MSAKVPLLADTDDAQSADAMREPTLHKIPSVIQKSLIILAAYHVMHSLPTQTCRFLISTLDKTYHRGAGSYRYSRAREVEEMFVSTVAVFLTEVIKCVICIFLVAQEEGGFMRLPNALLNQVVRQPGDTLKVCIPAMIYIIQNNLFYVAASHLDAATFMITSQLKIFTAAIFTVIILRRPLSRIQWIALGVLFVGVSLVQLQSSTGKDVSTAGQKPFVGFLAVVIACCLSGFAGIYFEKILKGSAPVSLWMRNIQMGVFAVPASFLGIFVQDGKFIIENGLLYGFDWVVWLTVLWYGIGGLSVAICIKYADNIAKNFATSVAIILATIGSVYLFGFQPSLTFSVGALLVIFSIFLYSSSQAMFQFFQNLGKLEA